MTTVGFFIFGYFAALFFFWRGLKKEGFPPRTAFDLFFLATFGFFFLGRLTFLLFGGEAVLPNLFFFWKGVLPVWGWLGGLVVFFDFVNRRKLSFFRLSDYFSAAVSLLSAVYLFGVGEFVYVIFPGAGFFLSLFLLSKIYSLPTFLNVFLGGLAFLLSSPVLTEGLLPSLDAELLFGLILVSTSLLGLFLFMIRKLGRRD